MGGLDRTGLAEFLRTRRAALQPEDVGLPRGRRRRTSGLRREEVAALSGMSPDYYARLERGSGPHPSDQMVAAIARGLRLSLAEHDHLFALAGHYQARRSSQASHVPPGLMRILDRLEDTPAQVVGPVGETLAQTRLARAVFGEQTRFVGMQRSVVYRWFTDPNERRIYLPADHLLHGRSLTAQLRRSCARHGPRSAAATLAQTLCAESDAFAALWNAYEVDLTFDEPKRLIHPEVGRLDLYCQTLLEVDQGQTLLVYTATPGSQSYDRLNLLNVVEGQHLTALKAT